MKHAPAHSAAFLFGLPLGLRSLVLLLVAVAFKLSLVPFHAWTPATYPRAGPPGFAGRRRRPA